MAQKSLEVLNKVNVSMIWYTTFFYKHYLWLSSQNLYLLYFFNKLFIYLDLFLPHFFWCSFASVSCYKRKNLKIKKTLKPTGSSIFFCKPVTSYLINLNEKFLLLNLYYNSFLKILQPNRLKKSRQDLSKLAQKFKKNKRLYYKLLNLEKMKRKSLPIKKFNKPTSITIEQLLYT